MGSFPNSLDGQFPIFGLFYILFQSTLLSTITKTESVQASYEFTTLTCIPGVIEHKGSNIQLLDLPGIIEGKKIYHQVIRTALL